MPGTTGHLLNLPAWRAGRAVLRAGRPAAGWWSPRRRDLCIPGPSRIRHAAPRRQRPVPVHRTDPSARSGESGGLGWRSCSSSWTDACPGQPGCGRWAFS